LKDSFSKDVFELLVKLGNYILEACHAGPSSASASLWENCLSGLDLFQVFANEAYEESVAAVQIIQIGMCKAWWWLSLTGPGLPSGTPRCEPSDMNLLLGDLPKHLPSNRVS